jgi:lipopolysaccharide/colanic/teichoic acid biosynthesis glycosyltransferase
MNGRTQKFSVQRLLKAIGDRVLAILLLVLFWPFLIVIAAAVYFWLGSPIIFAQPRPGKNERIFTFYKFRTMTDRRDAHGQLLPDEDRLTAFGQWLRQTSLDELPQLWNVLKGDMSFVGPRPLMVVYLERYSREQARRHLVLPGITGLAQVKGRNALSWDEKFRLDVWYVDHWSLGLDLKVLVLTIWKVIRREGINQDGFATAEEFKGQSPEL